MAKARDTATDRLSNVIEVVELARRTGLLSAERGAGAYLEEAEIYFVGGRAIYAATSGALGRDALVDVGQWGTCRFCFDTTAPRPSPNLAAPSEIPTSRPGANAWPTPSGVPAAPGGGRGVAPGWSAPASQPGFGPAYASAAPARSYPASERLGPDSGAWGGSQPGTAAPTGPLARRPRRVHDVRDLMGVVTSNNLSRSHRTVLLLADGSHNVLDLARLASKSVDDVTQLLAELEARGLLYYYE
jgi:hypothetical protein